VGARNRRHTLTLPQTEPCAPDTMRCEFWTWGRNYLRPDCCTTHLRELLAFTGDLLTRHGIFYFLDYGSLLGAVRSGRMIEWDEDADVSCLASDSERVLALEPEIADAGFWLDRREAPHLVRICRSRVNLIHVDIWFQRIKGGFSYTWSRLYEDRYRFPVKYLDNPGSVILEGKTHPAPHPVEHFLADHRYGKDFMSPRRVPANFGWVPGESSDELREALEQLRDVEYRIDLLESERTRGTSAAGTTPGLRGAIARMGGKVPTGALRVHRAAWKMKQRLAGVRDPMLLDVRYELDRRRTILRLLEPTGRENPK
jgi:hypothetical protein